MPGSWGGEGSPCREVRWEGHRPSASPEAPQPGLLWEITGRFPGDWRENTGELPKASVGSNRAPCGEALG